jgi:hypothetical protein
MSSDRNDLVTEPLQADKSLGELFGVLTSDLSLLMRQEVELAKTEVREEATRAGKARAGVRHRGNHLGNRGRRAGEARQAADGVGQTDSANRQHNQGGCRMGQDTEELKRSIESTRAEMGDTLEAIGDRVMPGRIAQRNKNRVVTSAQSIRERVMGSASGAQHAVSDTASHAVGTVKEAPDALVHKAQGAPMIAGALAFGVGFLVAAAFPPSEKEKELSSKVMDAIEPAKEQLMESAHEMADHLKQPAMEAAQAVKETASSGAQAVTSTAKDAAHETKDQAADAVASAKQGNSPA